MGIHGHGSITKTYKSLKPCKSMCSGCRNDFYNHSDLAPNGCWSFSTAEVVDKVGYASLHATKADTVMRKTLSCWHAVIH